MSGWGIQYVCDWYDYVDWADYDPDDKPLRFTTQDRAQAHIDTMLAENLARRMKHYRESVAKWRPRRSLYERRRQALIDVGLWTREGEGISPLLVPAGPGHKPVEHPENWRVVPDASMELPLAEWPQDAL